MILLASNENPLGMPAAARAAAAAAMAGSGNYPDANGTALKAALSRRLGVPPAWIVLGSGSSEILTLAAQACVQPGEGVVYSQYGFIVYGQAAALARARTTATPAREFGHDLEALRNAIDTGTRLVFVANPNNPTGTFIEGAALAAFIAGLPPHVTLLLDEAYTEYLLPGERYDSMAFVREHPNVIVARTFSKAYGLAGLRVGYGVAQPALAARLNAIRPRFNVNTPALEAAAAALDDTGFLARTLALNTEGRAQLAEGLAALGLRSVPSSGNFVMVHAGDAKAMHARLLAAGIAVSTLEPYGLAEWLRITVGLPEQNAKLLQALGEVPAPA